MLELVKKLKLDRCPYCSIATPNLDRIHHLDTANASKEFKRSWGIYECNSCGGIVIAAAATLGETVTEYYPESKAPDGDIPARPRDFLKQAMDSIHAPSGAVMLAASAIDAMLKIKGYKDGNLNARIEQAATDHLITEDMKLWAHDVRLDANDERHADEAASMPTRADAERVIDFAAALAEFLFVLPSRVRRGIKKATS